MSDDEPMEILVEVKDLERLLCHAFHIYRMMYRTTESEHLVRTYGLLLPRENRLRVAEDIARKLANERRQVTRAISGSPESAVGTVVNMKATMDNFRWIQDLIQDLRREGGEPEDDEPTPLIEGKK